MVMTLIDPHDIIPPSQKLTAYGDTWKFIIRSPSANKKLQQGLVKLYEPSCVS